MKGFGPKRLQLLEQLNIHTFADLIRFFPVEYVNDSEIVSIADAPEGKQVLIGN